ncbi:melanopsin-A-like [Dendronephthya gigantea]|uniref:melanopsin-A-like n=1 Tax=Dendronephthya gigantea TaxID=151771 RepID=UPI00106B4540|nr:melanopsin-A-like [Dendronephthya gigantea]
MERNLKNTCFHSLDIIDFVISLGPFDHDIFILFVLISAILSVFTCLGNTMVLLAYLKSSILRKKLSSIFVINLAVTDWLVGVIVHPLLMIFFVQTINDDSSCFLPSLLAVVIPILMMVSLFSVVGATAERFLAVVYPIYHRTELTKTRLRVFVLCSWAYATSWISILFLSEENAKIYVTLNCVLPIIMTLFVVILWVYIFIIIKGHAVVGNTCRGQKKTALEQRQKSERKTAKTFLVSTLSLYVSYTPLLIALFTSFKDPLHMICFLEIMLLTSVINPVIYGLGNVHVRNIMRKELLCG